MRRLKYQTHFLINMILSFENKWCFVVSCMDGVGNERNTQNYVGWADEMTTKTTLGWGWSGLVPGNSFGDKPLRRQPHPP